MSLKYVLFLNWILITNLYYHGFSNEDGANRVVTCSGWIINHKGKTVFPYPQKADGGDHAYYHVLCCTIR